jgi:hypothetical protein
MSEISSNAEDKGIGSPSPGSEAGAELALR